jgi:hypothetical protein
MSIGLGGLLEERYPLPEWALIFELSKGTGWRGQDGRCDAAAFNCYPSKGYHRLAFEMKTGRGDFLKELDTPKKRAWVEENFHQTYFVTTPGIAKVEEIPEGWGLLVATKTGSALRRVKVARHRELPPLPETLALAAIRSLTKRMHSFTIPFKFEDRTVTREDIDRYVHQTLDAQRRVLDDQVKQANQGRNRLQRTQEGLIEPFMVLARKVVPEWRERRDIEREPMKHVTVEAVQRWIEGVAQVEAQRLLAEARQAHEALGKLIESAERKDVASSTR